mmetsp:Transcript_20832/g.36748  ORF Transcript_20832/g.36748 Transcript_20832/m.36748 type:complete len:217 (-) Transcript_20832:364-1014(-)
MPLRADHLQIKHLPGLQRVLLWLIQGLQPASASKLTRRCLRKRPTNRRQPIRRPLPRRWLCRMLGRALCLDFFQNMALALAAAATTSSSTATAATATTTTSTPRHRTLVWVPARQQRPMLSKASGLDVDLTPGPLDSTTTVLRHWTPAFLLLRRPEAKPCVSEFTKISVMMEAMPRWRRILNRMRNLRISLCARAAIFLNVGLPKLKGTCQGCHWC